MVIYLLISTFEFASFMSLNVLDKIIQIGCFSHFGENDFKLLHNWTKKHSVVIFLFQDFWE